MGTDPPGTQTIFETEVVGPSDEDTPAVGHRPLRVGGSRPTPSGLLHSFGTKDFRFLGLPVSLRPDGDLSEANEVGRRLRRLKDMVCISICMSACLLRILIDLLISVCCKSRFPHGYFCLTKCLPDMSKKSLSPNSPPVRSWGDRLQQARGPIGEMGPRKFKKLVLHNHLPQGSSRTVPEKVGLDPGPPGPQSHLRNDTVRLEPQG